MVEPTTAAVAGLAILGSKDLIVKLLGPTADYLGEGLKTYTEKGANNLKRIFNIAFRRLGDKINEPSQVPPKVLKGILTEGYFCEDEVASEYFGGVLASSRSTESCDDRGATFLHLISGLSSYQIRTHYLLYEFARSCLLGENIRPGVDIGKMHLFVSITEFMTSMELDKNKSNQVIFAHSLNGLVRNKLLSNFISGDIKFLSQQINLPGHPQNIKFEESGFIYCPTLVGMELFLWAHGLGDITPYQFFDEKMRIDSFNKIKIIGKGNQIIIPDSSINLFPSSEVSG